MPKPARLAAPTCAALALLACSATAAPVSGGVDDPAGDVRVPGQDVVAAAVLYDASGIVTAAVSTAAPATEQTTPVIGVLLGKASPARGSCDVGFNAAMYPDPEGALGGLRVGGKDLGLQAVTQSGPVMRFDSTDGDGDGPPAGPRPALANKAWNCGVVVTSSPRLVHGDYSDADDTGVFPLTPKAGGRSPSCRVATTKVQRGGRLRVRCVGVAGRVTVRLHRNRPSSASTGRIAPDGRASVEVRRSVRRGEYLAAVWQGRTLMGSSYVHVR